MEESMPAGGGPLAGLRVVELAQSIAGPYVGKLFADAGAEVVKLEPPAGDSLRRWSASGQPVPPGGSGALFHYLNAGKRSAVADLETAQGRALALELLDAADIAIESFGPGGAARRGVGWETLRARNPRCTLVSISPWGGDGPWAGRPATEFTLQAATGATAGRGIPARGPVGAGGRIGEWIPGVYAAVGALAGYLCARRSGAGQHVDVSIFECLCLTLTNYHDLNSQFFPGPLAQSIITPSIEPTRDGWVGLATITGQQWKDFCALIEQPELAEDERFYDGIYRTKKLDFIQGIIHGWTQRHDTADIIERLSLARIPVNPLGNGQTLPEMDHLRARRVFTANPAGFMQPRPPYRLGAAQGEPPAPRPAPALGEHAAQFSGRAPAAPEPESTGTESALPFAGLRVLDLTAFWAGPVATSLLAELGADVIKVESIQRPDTMRFVNSAGDPMWEFNPLFQGANSSKRGITLNLDAPEGMALLHRLIAKADVVAENFSPRVLDNWGLGWEAVRALNPRAILLRMPSFGLDGPWRDRVGFAMNADQVSGLAWLTGYDDMPLVVGGVCDPLGGMHAVFALFLALEERRRNGAGQLVEVPLVEPAINIAAEQVIEWTAHGVLLERKQNRGPAAAPQGVYPCAAADAGGAGDAAGAGRPSAGEGAPAIALAVATDAQWQALRRVLGNPAWARDPALDSAEGRRRAHDRVDAELRAWTAARSSREAAEALRAAGVPAEACINPHGLWPNPQLAHRGFFQVVEHALIGPLRYPGLPMRFSGLPRNLRRTPAPMLGEHNEEVLRSELNLSDAEIASLREKKVIGERPAFM
ncbi:MAG: CoA transferase [Deltaproteobacteria bacterium]|nr:CoA transferase [Deltaproteobacteria bacterium]